MKWIFICLLIMPHGKPETELSLSQLRSLYYAASQKASEADRFYEMMKNADTKQPLLLGYKAMAEFMKCYHSYNPVNKLSYFYKGKGNLDQAISLDPGNAELRYLRFTVQTNVPSFLGYKEKIDEDKQFLITHPEKFKADAALNAMICDYMIGSDYCSPSEKEVFRKGATP
jgi:hypothetical protein